MPRWFTAAELSVLDAPTANNDAVLASLGGQPEVMKVYAEEESDGEVELRGVPGAEVVDGDGESDLHRRRSHSAVRQRMGSIHRATEHKTKRHSHGVEIATERRPSEV